MKNFLLFLFYFLSIFFLQGQVKVIDMEDPGSLSKLLGNEVNSITNLTINGSINPDDIKTLNNMKKLTVLDLSNSSVMDGILPTGAFQSNSVLKDIILPSNLTIISKEAFEYAYNISVDASKCSYLKNIGEYAFNGVKGKVSLPDHLESLPYRSFRYFNGFIVLPKNLKTIGKEAFSYSNVKNLDLSQAPNLHTINDYAFYYSKIDQIDLSKAPNLHTLGKGVFEGSEHIKLIDLSKNDLIKIIGEDAFYKVAGKVILPDYLESLPYRSFRYFNGFIVLPKNLKIIGKEAFSYSNVKNLDLSQAPNLHTISDYAFFYSKIDQIDLSKAPNLHTLGKGVFEGSEHIKLIDLSKNALIKIIGEDAFYEVAGKVILPDYLESLPYRSFRYFNGIIVLPKNLKTIGKEAFYNSLIKEITLPASLKNINTEAFYNAKQLASITSNNSTPPSLGKNVFNGVDKNNCLLQVPNSSRQLYAKADQWKDFQFKEANLFISLNLPDTDFSVNTPFLVSTTLENKGKSEANNNGEVAYFLSEDDRWDDNDYLLAKHSISETIPAKDKISFTTSISFPDKLGNFFLLAVIIPKDSADIPLEDYSSFAGKIHLSPEYKVSINPLDRSIYSRGEKIIFNGKARLADKSPAIDKNIKINIVTAGTKREFFAKTNTKGEFTYTFTPFDEEFGFYQVGASHPDISTSAAQTDFTILGIDIIDSNIIFKGIVNNTVEGSIEVKNKTHLTLHTVTVHPKVNSDSYSISFEPLTVLEPGKSAFLKYKLNAKKVTLTDNYESAAFDIKAEEGNLAEFSAKFTATTGKAYLEVKKFPKDITVTKGKKRLVEYTLFNSGKENTGKISLSLPSEDWFRILSPATASIDNLPPGQTATFTIELTGKSDLPLNSPFKGSIAVNTEKANSILIPFDIEFVSENVGSLWVDVVDEYSYNTPSKPHVKNAKVVISHPFSGKVLSEGLTDQNGLYKLDSIPEGYYTVSVSADKHESYKNNILINAGKLNNQRVFISYMGVSYTWEVTPTEIEDEYDIDLKVDYETNVPQPVVIMEFPKPLPDLKPGNTYSFMVTLTNKGLIAAENAKIQFDSYNNYVFTPLVNKVNIPALTAIQIPVVMSMNNSNNNGSNGNGEDNNNNNSSNGNSEDNNNNNNGSNGNSEDNNNNNGSNGNGEDNNNNNGSNGNGEDNNNNNGSNDNNNNSDNNNSNKDKNDDKVNKNNGCISYVKVFYEYKCGNTTVKKSSYKITHINPGCNNNNSSGHLDLSNGSVSTGSGGFIPIVISGGCTPLPPCLIEAGGAIISCNPLPPYIGCAYSFITSGVNTKNIILCLIGFLEKKPSKFGIGISCVVALYDFFNCALEDIINKFQKSGSDKIQINDMEAILNFINTVNSYYAEYYGNSIMNSSSFLQFANATAAHLGDNKPFTPQDIANIKSLFANSDISSSTMDNFFTRWNLTLQAWDNGVYTPNDNYPDIVNKTKLNEYLKTMISIKEYVSSRGYDSIDELYADRLKEAKEYFTRKQNSVCAKVSLDIKQKMVMTREAFEGNFTLTNGSQQKEITNIKLDIEIRDDQGNLANDLFQINIKSLTDLSAIDGTGSLDPGKKGFASILFIPTKKAAPNKKKSYSFGGTLSYTNPLTDEVTTVKLFPSILDVHPSPEIYLDYFMQRNIFGDDPLTEDIEPIIPAELGLIIHNKGMGTAKNVHVSSAQPQIVDNQKGLAIDFDIIGSNLNGKKRQLGITNIDFGTIEGGKTAVGQWWFTSSLLGHFIDFEAKISHSNSFGNPDLSLIGGIKIHELIKSVRVYGNQDDGINDFLVNDSKDIRDFPDSLFLSSGGTEPVFRTKNIVIKEKNSDTFVSQIEIIPSKEGWNYGLINDPWNGKYVIIKIVRNDGVIIPLDNFWLTQCTLRDNADPVYENKLHIIDKFESIHSAIYTVYWEINKNNAVRVEAITHVPEKTIYESLNYVDVRFNTPINPTTFTYKDLYLSCQGGKNLIDSSITINKIDERNYRVYIGSKTMKFGYYRFRVLTNNIEDANGNKGSTGKEASWTQSHKINLINVSGILNDGQPVDKVIIQFNMPVNFTKESIYLRKGKSETILLDNVTISNSEDKTIFTVQGLKQYNYMDGNYLLVIDLSKVTDTNGNKGNDSHSEKWMVYPANANIKLYPNPVLYNLTLESNIPFKWYHIVSLFGKSEFYQTFPDHTYKAIIETNNSWNKGIYLIFIYDSNNKLIAVKRFIKI
ncbi:leucine-rich repeat protein [Apibacter mensalis]|uniref:leucine-rich repeat protein n=1 Tax=Apibacter mensalis TaxID=1586267 RepID=UPI0026EE5859|nr:leucine-rich repeat protein [Apibacter mensalis]